MSSALPSALQTLKPKPGPVITPLKLNKVYDKQFDDLQKFHSLDA